MSTILLGRSKEKYKASKKFPEMWCQKRYPHGDCQIWLRTIQ